MGSSRKEDLGARQAHLSWRGEHGGVTGALRSSAWHWPSPGIWSSTGSRRELRSRRRGGRANREDGDQDQGNVFDVTTGTTSTASRTRSPPTWTSRRARSSGTGTVPGGTTTCGPGRPAGSTRAFIHTLMADEPGSGDTFHGPRRRALGCPPQRPRRTRSTSARSSTTAPGTPAARPGPSSPRHAQQRSSAPKSSTRTNGRNG